MGPVILSSSLPLEPSADDETVTCLQGSTVCTQYSDVYATNPARSSRKGNSHSRLMVPMVLRVGEGELQLRTLIDTGSEHNLIRTGVVDGSWLQPARRHITFLAANGSPLAGGAKEVIGDLCMIGRETESPGPLELRFPIALYEANIPVDAIISYR